MQRMNATDAAALDRLFAELGPHGIGADKYPDPDEPVDMDTDE